MGKPKVPFGLYCQFKVRARVALMWRGMAYLTVTQVVSPHFGLPFHLHFKRVGAYYLNLLWNWYSQPELYRPELLLDDPLIFGATNLLVGCKLVVLC